MAWGFEILHHFSWVHHQQKWPFPLHLCNWKTKVYFLVCVDDLLLTGNDNNFLHAFIITLCHKFALKNVGNPHYFLGVKFIATKHCIFLSQHNYIHEILEKFDVEGEKSTSTPLSPSTTLHLHDGTTTVMPCTSTKSLGLFSTLLSLVQTCWP